MYIHFYYFVLLVRFYVSFLQDGNKLNHKVYIDIEYLISEKC